MKNRNFPEYKKCKTSTEQIYINIYVSGGKSVNACNVKEETSQQRAISFPHLFSVKFLTNGGKRLKTCDTDIAVYLPPAFLPQALGLEGVLHQGCSLGQADLGEGG